MRLDPKARITGYRHIEIRNFLRELERHGARQAAERNLPDSHNVEVLVNELQATGMIVWGTQSLDGRSEEPRWVLTPLGLRFCHAKANKPIDRSKADRIVADILDRVRKVVSDDGQLFEVERLFLFGSYIQNTADCGDTDVCFDRRPKAKFNAGRTGGPLSKELQRRQRALMIKDGYRPQNFLDELFYVQNKLKRTIKGGIAAISLHDIEDLKSTAFPFMIAYEAEGAPALDWERLKGKTPEYFDVHALAARISALARK